MLGEIVGEKQRSMRDSAASQRDVRRGYGWLEIRRELMKLSDFMMPRCSQNFPREADAAKTTGTVPLPLPNRPSVWRALPAQNVDRCKGHQEGMTQLTPPLNIKSASSSFVM